MNIEALVEKLTSLLGGQGFGKTVNLDLGAMGVVHIDGNQSPPAISIGDTQADGTISMSLDNLLKLADGALDPMGAVMSGQLKIKGDMGAVTALQSALID